MQATSHEETGYDVQRVQRWMRLQAAFWIGFGVACLRYEGAFVATPILILLSYAWLWRLLGSGARVADYVTGSRLLLVAGALALVLQDGAVSPLAWWLLVVASLADLADGWAARRWGGSRGGAVLDMETDQFAFVVFAFAAYAFDGVASFVLLLAASRYLYVLLMSLRGVPVHDPKPLDGDNRRAKIICAVVVTLQLAVLSPFVPTVYDHWLALTAVALLAFSYSSDVVQLLVRRA